MAKSGKKWRNVAKSGKYGKYGKKWQKWQKMAKSVIIWQTVAKVAKCGKK